MSARNRELIALIPASLLVVAGFAGVFIQRSNIVSNASLTYGAVFFGLCLAAHVAIRVTAPHADPYIFPLVAALACFGIVMVYRIDVAEARRQAEWFVVGLILFLATLVALRDYRRLERYRYTIVVGALLILTLPRVPGLGQQVNGAYLAVHIPGLGGFQPEEFAKIGLVVFLASYLRDTRQLLVTGGRRILGVTIPPLKHFGPILVIWGVAMAIMILLSDMGSSLMLYGGLLAMLYVATGRLSFAVVGLLAFALGAWYLGTHISHVHARVEDWLHPFDPRLYNAPLGSYQVANGIFAQAAGGLFGQGFGRAVLTFPGSHPAVPLIPAPATDMIYAVIASELGLFGAVAVLVAYLLLIARGFKAAVLARDSFSTLLATGLSAIVAIQVFVIVGGVTRVIPLTGVTLPFISYGGSSIVANFVLVALLLQVSDRARRPVRGVGMVAPPYGRLDRERRLA
jgi:cell division protein FtsW (lipid II flippase)